MAEYFLHDNPGFLSQKWPVKLGISRVGTNVFCHLCRANGTETGHDLHPILPAISVSSPCYVTASYSPPGNKHRLVSFIFSYIYHIPLIHISGPSGALKAAKYPTHRGGAGYPEMGQMPFQVSHEQRPHSASDLERHANRILSALEIRKTIFTLAFKTFQNTPIKSNSMKKQTWSVQRRTKNRECCCWDKFPHILCPITSVCTWGWPWTWCSCPHSSAAGCESTDMYQQHIQSVLRT